MTRPGRTVDVVVVSYNSRSTLRSCVERLSVTDGLFVFVVDNASTDGSLEAIRDLDVTTFASQKNSGFAAGCNQGWRAGRAPFVLFLNPDARIDPASVETLASVAEADETVGIVAPRILSSQGALEFSQRRFPALRSTFSQALLLHRLFRHSTWSDELVRDPEAYRSPQSPDWVSGACLLARRSVLELVDGWDESFFLYSEDTDLCRRVHLAGYEVRYEPTATAVHLGGHSMPRAASLPLLAQSRILYARKHQTGATAVLQRVGVALSSFTHMFVARTKTTRLGYAQALRAAFRG